MMEARPIDTDLFQKFLDINSLKMWGSKNITSWIHIENKKDLLNKKVFQMWEFGFLQMSQSQKYSHLPLSIQPVYSFILIVVKQDVRGWLCISGWLNCQCDSLSWSQT